MMSYHCPRPPKQRAFDTSLLIWRRRMLGGGDAWTPADLGATLLTWLEPDPARMFQTYTGGDAVSADGQPVGFVRSKKEGIGADVLPNGTFDDATGWTLGTGWSVTGGKLVATAGSDSTAETAAIGTELQYYLVTLTATVTAGGFNVRLGNGGTDVLPTPLITASGTYNFVLRCGTTGRNLIITKDSAFAGDFDNITVRHLPGNHAGRAVSSARPLYRANAGKPYFQFDGSDDGFIFLSRDAVTHNVYMRLRTSDASAVLLFDNTLPTSRYVGVIQDTNASVTYAGTSPNPTDVVDGATVSPATRDGLHTAAATGSFVTLEHRGFGMPSWTTTGLSCGYYVGFPFAGDVAAIIFTNAATETTQDRDNIRAYLESLIP